jgi:hypothetical protein
VGDVLFHYMKKMPVHAILSLIMPVPGRIALLAASKGWQWLKVLFPGQFTRVAMKMPRKGPSKQRKTLEELMSQEFADNREPEIATIGIRNPVKVELINAFDYRYTLEEIRRENAKRVSETREATRRPCLPPRLWR